MVASSVLNGTAVSPPSRLRECYRRETKDGRCRAKMFETLTNSLRLWLSSHNLHKTAPSTSPHRCGRGPSHELPAMDSWQLMATGEGVSFPSVCSRWWVTLAPVNNLPPTLRQEAIIKPSEPHARRHGRRRWFAERAPQREKAEEAGLGGGREGGGGG